MDKISGINNINLDDIFQDRQEIPDNWLIAKDKLIDVQNDILKDDSYNFLVQGPAGSGKTVLATHRLMDLLAIGEKDNLVFIVYTLALKEFIKAGLENTLGQYEEETLGKMGLYDLNIDALNIHNINSKDCLKAIDNKDIGYVIVDEVQDMEKADLKRILEEHTKVMFFGDSDQMLYKHGTSLDEIINIWGNNFKEVYEIREHYRVPKKIMKFASKIINKPELIEICKSEESTKEQIKQCNNFEEEIEFVIKTIKDYELRHVGIFVNNNTYAGLAKDIFDRHNIECNYKIGLHEIELNFNDIDTPTLLTYHSSKGVQFQNVFVVGCGKENVYGDPDCDEGDFNYKNALFVACTRTTRGLFLTYSGEINLFMKDII